MRKKIAIALTAGVAAATVGFGASRHRQRRPEERGRRVRSGRHRT
jgi:hypothetical protein